MGEETEKRRKETRRKIRKTPLTDEEWKVLQEARYEGSPFHKRNPGDFGFAPAPRQDKTLCDEAGVFTLEEAQRLLSLAVERGLVSDTTTHGGFPKQMWVVDEEGRVFEAMHGGSHDSHYHGYPIRETDPLHQLILSAWRQQ
ncbi:MAG: hypothetical protein RL885_17915 [Planctomycetota bacterium]